MADTEEAVGNLAMIAGVLFLFFIAVVIEKSGEETINDDRHTGEAEDRAGR
jgi:hypothetical protein